MSEVGLNQTPAERRYGEIHDRVKAALMRTVFAALEDATERARTEVEAAGLDLPPLPYGFFAATAHQQLYCTLCGANPDTFAGGRADVALRIIRNSQNIAAHHWGADIEPPPRP